MVADQNRIHQTTSNVEKIRRITREGDELVAAIPITVQVLPEIPAFINGQAKEGRRKVLDSGETIDKAAANMLLHLTDLKYQAYKDVNDNPMVQFDMEIDKLSEEEREEKYDEISREAAALRSRAGISGRAFQELVERKIKEGGGTVRKRRLGIRMPDSEDIDSDIQGPFGMDESLIEDDEDDGAEQLADKKEEPKQKADGSKKAKEETKRVDASKKPSNLLARAAELFLAEQSRKK